MDFDNTNPLEHTYAVPPSMENTYELPPVTFRNPPPFVPTMSSARNKLDPLDSTYQKTKKRKKKKRKTKPDTTTSDEVETPRYLPQPYFSTSTPLDGSLPPLHLPSRGRLSSDDVETTHRYDTPERLVNKAYQSEDSTEVVVQKTDDGRPKKPALAHYEEEEIRSNLSAKEEIVTSSGEPQYQDPEQLYYHHSSQNSNPVEVEEQLPKPKHELGLNFLDFPASEDENPDYRKLAMELAMRKVPLSKHPVKFADYVLVYPADGDLNMLEPERKNYQNILKREGLKMVESEINNEIHVEIFCPFDRLCQEAERICLQMPLQAIQEEKDNPPLKKVVNPLQTEVDVTFISAPFTKDSYPLFYGSNNPSTFFRPAYRSLIVHRILENTKSEVKDEFEDNTISLSKLLHNGVYTDAYIPHEPSALENEFSDEIKATNKHIFVKDRRSNLASKWWKWNKYQPLRNIRNYFGEKIALYFAWLGMYITFLWVAVLLGIIVFIYGFVESYYFRTQHGGDRWNTAEKEQSLVEKLKTWVLHALDNNLTPAFSLFICLWGVVFLEFWKRKNAALAYHWDVEDFEEQEPNRPQFYGTKMVKDPYSGNLEPVYPKWRKVIKSMGSASIVITMGLMVIGSVMGVLIFKLVSQQSWFASRQFVSTILSSILNSTSIQILGFLYKRLAYRLTEWENHRTPTHFEDALIFKLFGFQFVNSYASLIYIAFFRKNTEFDIDGEKYKDGCGGESCISVLTLQVATNMVLKPSIKFFTDVIFPFFKKRVVACRRNNAVEDDPESVEAEPDSNILTPEDVEYEAFLKYEYSKPPLVDFTLGEFTEKVIQYGYVVLFAAAFPLAPLIAIISNLIDMRVDAKRMLIFNRRPIAKRAEDIGMWLTWLTLLNYLGIVTNGFLLAQTSEFGQQYEKKLIYNASCACTNSSVLPATIKTSLSNTTLNPVTQSLISTTLTLINTTTKGALSANGSIVNTTTAELLSSTAGLASSTVAAKIASTAAASVANCKPKQEHVTVYENLWIVIIFENVVLLFSFVLAYAIPDVPEHITKAIHKEKHELDRILEQSGRKRGPGKTISMKSDSAPMTGRSNVIPTAPQTDGADEEVRMRKKKTPRQDSRKNLVDEEIRF